jgi:uncharacterized membrane protein
VRSEVGIRVAAPEDVVFGLASEVARWPERLPHYRYVRRLGSPDERRFAFGARRGRIPVRWEAVVRPLPEAHRLEFRHTGGVTRGMAVAWTFASDADGIVDVTIEHELTLGWPLIGGLAARFIDREFIGPIARRTLRRVRALSEARA